MKIEVIEKDSCSDITFPCLMKCISVSSPWYGKIFYARHPIRDAIEGIFLGEIHDIVINAGKLVKISGQVVLEND